MVEPGERLSSERRVLIAITPERPVADESAKIVSLLRGGFYRVHLRHPDATEEEIRTLLEKLPQEARERVVLHSHFGLANQLNVGGFHLNRRHPVAPEGYNGPLSSSCHSVEEVMQTDPRLDYVTLSPIFDSISKGGYLSAFTDHASLGSLLASAPVPVIALGGITPDKFKELSRIPFSGYAMLGAIPWSATPGEIELFATATVKLLHIK